MKKIKIDPGCISCGTCAFMAPDIFEVTDISRVKPEAPINTNEEAIKKAVESCPMNIIHYGEEFDETR